MCKAKVAYTGFRDQLQHMYMYTVYNERIQHTSICSVLGFTDVPVVFSCSSYMYYCSICETVRPQHARTFAKDTSMLYDTLMATR